MTAMSARDDKYQSGSPRSPDEIEPSVIISPDTRRSERLPPGQSRTRKWPVLHYGFVPTISLDRWKLQIFGLVERALVFSWREFQELPRVKVYADFHCVTRWSRLDNVWEGVATREILERAGAKPEARFVVAHGYDSGWTTNLPLADFLSEDALIADTHDGEPLTADHGGPCRLIIPQLYAWKSAKWLRAIELVAADRPGYWEQGGYHNRGDPWNEQRFG
jgi:DMSO/TMAO reductase YedYZ molybdopterin-dependent catalytic subunit